MARDFRKKNLRYLNSFQVPAYASHYIQFHQLEQIQTFLSNVSLKTLPLYILGGGTNTLFVGDFLGYLLHPRLLGMQVIQETKDLVFVRAASGEQWHHLVNFCIERGYWGLENLSLIPGSVGGAPVQNIGAYGVELRDVFYKLEAVELSTGKMKVFSPQACEFGYRTSVFKTSLSNQYLITHVTLTLSKRGTPNLTYQGIKEQLDAMHVSRPSLREISQAIIALRSAKLPNPEVLGNAGSFFQNPSIQQSHYQLLKKKYPQLLAYPTHRQGWVKVSAAWAIEAAGCRALSTSQAGIYANHALVLVNYGQATGKDIAVLSEKIQQRVYQHLGIALVAEVNRVGGSAELFSGV